MPNTTPKDLSKMSKDERELVKEIENRRARVGAGRQELEDIARIHPVLGTRDELKHLDKIVRNQIEKQRKEIADARKELKDLRKEDPIEEAVKWARSKLGVTEQPPGSNWGHPVQDWNIWMGYGTPQPWCGIFAGYAACKIGGANVPAPIHIGSASLLAQDARAGVNGMRAVPVVDCRPGDIFAYGTVHIGFCIAKYSNGQVHAIEGNTSPGSEGSQYNGGCVADKIRPASMVTTCVRLNYN